MFSLISKLCVFHYAQSFLSFSVPSCMTPDELKCFLGTEYCLFCSWLLYLFLRTVIRDDHQLGDLTLNRFISLQLWRPCSLRRLEGRLLPYFQVFLCVWLHSSHLCPIFTWLSPLTPLSLLHVLLRTTLGIGWGHIWIVKDDFVRRPLISAKTLGSNKVIFTVTFTGFGL